MSDLDLVLSDLVAESAVLDGLVSNPGCDWRTPTPAAGWTIAHQIAHLRWTDTVALLAIEDPAGMVELGRLALSDPHGFVDHGAAEGALLAPDELLAQWRTGRDRLAQALRTVPAGTKLAWFGPPMSATSMATARLMETWAHGLDVADALGELIVPTERLRHIARLAVRTRDFSFLLRDRAVPGEEFRVELTAPDGSSWAFGPEDARQRVSGPALDLCLLATQRRHRNDLALQAIGPDAEAWLDLVQAFAGLAGPGRPATA